MNPSQWIKVKGARVHNLKNINVSIPRDKLVVITGLSGSGKSSLAFDTIYAEGQRRYVESLSSYARQFLQMQDKPDVDLIEGLSPAISIEQKTTSKNPRSTVATVTEIYDYLRLLFARIGVPHCYQCQDPIEGKSASQMVDEVMEIKEGAKLSILAPIIRERKGEYRKELESLKKEGFVRVRIDGELRLLEEDISLNPKVKHTIEVVIDRVVVRSNARMRISEAVELALKMSKGFVLVVRHQPKKDEEKLLSEHFSCIRCGISYPEIEPRMFSFNAPQGACASCSGLGNYLEFDEDLVVPDGKLSLKKGAIRPFRSNLNGYYAQMLACVAQAEGISMSTPFDELSKAHKKLVLFGTKKIIDFEIGSQDRGRTHRFSKRYEGIMPNLKRRYGETQSDAIRDDLERFMAKSPCAECDGERLRIEARNVLVAGRSISELVKLSVKDAYQFFTSLKFEGRSETIGTPILKEVNSRLQFLLSVGLEYLSLHREAGTLSGGEAQRIRLATQIGSALMGVLYVLDEPSIGLHQRDNDRLLKTLCRLRDLGNTVLVVEHDEDTILASDYVLDMGPGAGNLGGELVAHGTPAEVKANKKSLTGQYLSRQRAIEIPEYRRAGNGKTLSLIGASGNNLQAVDLDLPLGTFICVTGVSGSGKSTLINDTLHRSLAQAIYGAKERPLPFEDIKGLENIDKVIDIDQSPIGRTPRSNPVTYTGIFDDIRQLFAGLPEAAQHGYKAGRFSFNVKGGRCETCRGGGVNRIEMNFLPDVYVTCDLCQGKRFNSETLSILYKGKNIADVLDMTVDVAAGFFGAIPSVIRKLKTLQKVGLGYVHLGQQATTLSGGEAQRIKLSKELSRRSTGNTLYILDEPTTGLHFEDVNNLLSVLHHLCDQGNTMLVIEHNLDVIKNADYVFDLGPEGGEGGGQIIAQGPPEMIAQEKKSFTGQFLADIFKRDNVTVNRRAVLKPKVESLDLVRGRKAKKSRIQSK